VNPLFVLNKSYSFSASSAEEFEDGLEPDEEEEEAVPELKSDHEFSPESDLELGPGEEVQPARRARTVTAKRGETIFTIKFQTPLRSLIENIWSILT
jgi:hypothetical protein